MNDVSFVCVGHHWIALGTSHRWHEYGRPKGCKKHINEVPMKVLIVI